MSRFLGFLLLLAPLTAAAPLAAQSLLDRPPNVSGDWIAPPGTVQFNFLHRFVASSAPARKVTNFPTFVIGAGLPKHTQVGFLYSTNSTLTPNYPNEWEFYGRWLPLSQDRGAPLDLGGQVGYNLAVKGLDGEISIARAAGPGAADRGHARPGRSSGRQRGRRARRRARASAPSLHRAGRGRW